MTNLSPQGIIIKQEKQYEKEKSSWSLKTTSQGDTLSIIIHQNFIIKNDS